MIAETLITLSLPYADKGSKTVRVYVPAHREEEMLPVIYMTDGQNLFEKNAMQYGCWEVRETVRAVQADGGKGAVIVGIHNDGAPYERGNELTPADIAPFVPAEVPEEMKRLLKPAGEVFDDFVLHTVMPAVEARCPVKRDRESTAFCGSSMGGLECFYTVLRHPDRYAAGGVFSPVFAMYQKPELEEWIRARAQAPDLPALTLYLGGADPMEQQLTPDFQWVCRVLESCWPSERLTQVIRPEQLHHESAWKTEFADFLRRFLS